MLKAYKAGIGALGTFWYMYVYWLLMETAAYSIFAKKDYDYYDYYDEEEEERAADPSTIDVSAIFNGLKAIREKSSRVSDDPCYLQSFCQARQYLGSFLPNFLRKMLSMERNQGMDCRSQNPNCNWQMFLMKMMQ